MYEKIKLWYKMGLWTDTMVENAVVKGILKQEEANEIINKL